MSNNKKHLKEYKTTVFDKKSGKYYTFLEVGYGIIDLRKDLVSRGFSVKRICLAKNWNKLGGTGRMEDYINVCIGKDQDEYKAYGIDITKHDKKVYLDLGKDVGKFSFGTDYVFIDYPTQKKEVVLIDDFIYDLLYAAGFDTVHYGVIYKGYTVEFIDDETTFTYDFSVTIEENLQELKKLLPQVKKYAESMEERDYEEEEYARHLL